MIEDVLSLSSAEAWQRLRRDYDAIEGVDTRPIVLFGAGPLGRRTAAMLAAHQLGPVAFADNDPAKWGAVIDGVKVLVPEVAAATYRQTGTFVVTIYNSAAACAQLRALGCIHVLPFARFYYAQASALLPWYSLDDPAQVLDAKSAIVAAAALWADDASRAEFTAQIAWRLGAPALSNHDSPRECYFPADLIAVSEQTCVVDCGAFDGDSLRLLRDRGDRFGEFLALEPDPQSFERLTSFVATLPAGIQQKIKLRQVAVAATAGTIGFNAGGTVESGFSASGGLNVEAVPLDDLLTQERVGLIKMDVEGAELDALAGARATLVRDRPALAISAYHRISDLWTIPLLIKSIVPEYDLYLRRYAEDCWELVCYAIHPSSRRPA